MIARTHRFHGHGSLRYVYQKGKTVRGPLCALKYVPNTKREHYRLAVVVSKKVNKSAVVRNRIRRRLFEAVRQHEKDFNDTYDLIFTVFSDQIVTLSSDEIKKLVYSQFNQADIL